MNTQHTPGPWHIKTSASGNYFVYSDSACKSDDRIAGINYCYPNTDIASANARLIAACPDLLAALQAIDQRLRECSRFPITASEAYDTFYQDIVSDAIKKATGE